MNSCKPRMIHEKSKIIPINKTLNTKNNEDFKYSLTNNFFDPSKNSPPNEFMLKLKLRMSHYDSFSNVDSLINE